MENVNANLERPHRRILIVLAALGLIFIGLGLADYLAFAWGEGPLRGYSGFNPRFGHRIENGTVLVTNSGYWKLNLGYHRWSSGAPGPPLGNYSITINGEFYKVIEHAPPFPRRRTRMRGIFNFFSEAEDVNPDLYLRRGDIVETKYLGDKNRKSIWYQPLYFKDANQPFGLVLLKYLSLFLPVLGAFLFVTCLLLIHLKKRGFFQRTGLSRRGGRDPATPEAATEEQIVEELRTARIDLKQAEEERARMVSGFGRKATFIAGMVVVSAGIFFLLAGLLGSSHIENPESGYVTCILSLLIGAGIVFLAFARFGIRGWLLVLAPVIWSLGLTVVSQLFDLKTTGLRLWSSWIYLDFTFIRCIILAGVWLLVVPLLLSPVAASVLRRRLPRARFVPLFSILSSVIVIAGVGVSFAVLAFFKTSWISEMLIFPGIPGAIIIIYSALTLLAGQVANPRTTRRVSTAVIVIAYILLGLVVIGVYLFCMLGLKAGYWFRISMFHTGFLWSSAGFFVLQVVGFALILHKAAHRSWKRLASDEIHRLDDELSGELLPDSEK